MERLIHPDNLDIGIVKEIGHEGERCCSTDSPGVSESHEFRQHIGMGDPVATEAICLYRKKVKLLSFVQEAE